MQQEQNQTKSNRPLWIILGLVALLLACACFVALAVAAFFIPRGANVISGIGGIASARVTASTDLAPERYNVSLPASLVVRNSVGDVEVRVGDDNAIVVEVTKTARSFSQQEAEDLVQRINVETSASANEVQIRVDQPVLIGAEGTNVNLRLVVPRQTHLRIQNGVGTVDVRGVEGRAEVRVDVGAVTLDSVVLEANSTLSSGVGDVRVTGELRGSGRVEVNSGVGDLRVELPANAAFNLDAESSVGSIRNDFPLSNAQTSDNPVSDRLRGQSGSAPTIELYLRSGTGSINLRQR